jgi:hypothetical protein
MGMNRHKKQTQGKGRAKLAPISILDDMLGKGTLDPLRIASVLPDEQILRQLAIGQPFTPVEDAVIIRTMQLNLATSWDDVAERLPGRTGPQCRDRWFNCLAREVPLGRYIHEENQLPVRKNNEIAPTLTATRPSFNGPSTPGISGSVWPTCFQFGSVNDDTTLINIEREMDSSNSDQEQFDGIESWSNEGALSIIQDVMEPVALREPPMSLRPAPGLISAALANRRRFTADEDAVITRGMQSDPPDSWHHIAKRLPGHTVRQCRERWLNYLSPDIRSEPWSPEEDQLLVEKIRQMGRTWTAMRAFFNGRSAADIKNRWFCHLRFELARDSAKFEPTEKDPNCPFLDCRTPNESNGPADEGRPMRHTNTENEFEDLWEEPLDELFALTPIDPARSHSEHGRK